MVLPESNSLKVMLCVCIGSNNVKEHKADHKNRKGAYLCDFHMHPKLFMKFLEILHGKLTTVHCLILCLKLFRLS